MWSSRSKQLKWHRYHYCECASTLELTSWQRSWRAAVGGPKRNWRTIGESIYILKPSWDASSDLSLSTGSIAIAWRLVLQFPHNIIVTYFHWWTLQAFHQIYSSCHALLLIRRQQLHCIQEWNRRYYQQYFKWQCYDQQGFITLIIHNEDENYVHAPNQIL